MKPNITPVSGLHGIEKGTAIIEHVTLNVGGLTCVGCENKLSRSLDAIPGIRNLQTSLVMSQADTYKDPILFPLPDMAQLFEELRNPN